MGTTLGGDDTAFTESIVEKLEVWLLEQSLGWSLWVGRVGDDNVECILVVVEELEAVANVDLDFWMLVGHGHVWEVLLGETNNCLFVVAAWSAHLVLAKVYIKRTIVSYLINVAENSLLYTLVLDNLSQHTAVSTTNDQHLLWIRV